MKKIAALALAALASSWAFVEAQTVENRKDMPFWDYTLTVDQRVDDLISRLTPEEKVSLMMNRSMAIDRLGIPAYNWWGEACHGLAGVGDVTVFPQCIALGATFDDENELIMYSMVSDEARGRYNSMPRVGDIGPYVSWLPNLTFWAPNVNIFRDPRWGRGQETYGEDPYLTSVMGLNVVKGMQGDDPTYYKTHACAKHYAVHSGPEPLRHKFNAVPSDRDLWETYLPAFKTLVVDGNVQEVMCAYSAVNGQPCCNSSQLLIKILRDMWGYKGLVVSDCDAINDLWIKSNHGTHPDAMTASSDAVRTGTDLECGKSYESLVEGLRQGTISEAELDVSLRRLLKARIELGMFDPDEINPYSTIPGSVVDCQAHRDHALLLAQEAQVLLKNNNNTLPLSKQLKRIAVVGPNADNAEMMRGNYSGTPTHCVTILDGIRNKVPGTEVDYIRGCEIDNDYIQIPKMQLVQGKEGAGLDAQYFATTDWSGPAVKTVRVTSIDYMTDGGYGFGDGVPQSDFTAKYTGKIKSDFTGDLCFSIAGTSYVIKVNGDTIGQHMPKPLSFVFTPGMELTDAQRKELMESGMFRRRFVDEVLAPVKEGETYDIEILYKSATEGNNSRLKLDITERRMAQFDELKEQLAAYDAVIFVGGITPSQEGEGHERQNIELPAVQQRCLKALSETGLPVVFVQCSGSCVGLATVEPFYDAMLQSWYPGQEGGTAVADVLFGDFNPSGKLPVTFYKSTSQLPDFQDYNMDGRTYRYFDGEPMYPFGFGLSYTDFGIGEGRLSKSAIKAGESVDITVPVINNGDREGAEVVQVYVKSLTNPDAPIKSLKAFKRVNLKPSEKTDVTLTLAPDAFAYYNADKYDLDIFPGNYQLMYGSSSRDSDLKVIDFTVE